MAGSLGSAPSLGQGLSTWLLLTSALGVGAGAGTERERPGKPLSVLQCAGCPCSTAHRGGRRSPAFWSRARAEPSDPPACVWESAEPLRRFLQEEHQSHESLSLTAACEVPRCGASAGSGSEDPMTSP